MPVLLLMLALLAESPPPPPAPVIDGLPRWKAKPSAQDFLKVYPREAYRKGLPGRVIMTCEVLADGHLDACAVIEETPSDNGFGAAALSLAPYFQISTVDRDGRQLAGGAVRIPLFWRPLE